MKKILILGSEGQIGKSLEEYLSKKGFAVTGLDLTIEASHDLRKYNNFTLYKSIADCDFVYFLAFDVGGSRYLKEYQYTFDFIDNNTCIMSNVFKVLEEFKKPFIFASSQMSNMSYSPYGVAKALGEYYTKSLNGRIVKFWNVYGIERDMNKAHAITDFILKAKHTGVIDMLTDGQEERQLLYSDDCCRCLQIVAENFESISINKEIHITNFEWYKIIDVANKIADMFPGAKVVPSRDIDSVQLNKKNEPDPYILNFWKPKISLDEGIQRVVDFYKNSNY